MTSLDDVRRIDKVLHNVLAFDETGLVSMDQGRNQGLQSRSENFGGDFD